MTHTTINEPLIILAIAVVAFLAMLGRAEAKRIGLPGMVASLAIGIALSGIFALTGEASRPLTIVFDILGRLGVVALLFEAGMHTDVRKLVSQLGHVVLTWAANVVVAGGLGFVVARFAIGYDLIPSLVIAVAMTATSVGISTSIWEEHELEGSRDGRHFLGIASLDDISAVVLMAVLFSVAPVLRGSGDGAIAPAILGELALTLVELVGFGGLCVLFSQTVEHRMREWLQRFESAAAALVSVVSVSIIIAAIAGLLGFSMAIGAFFAGLAFSRDPQALRQHIAFDAIYDLFVPFFFIGIGLSIDLSAVGGSIVAGALLLVVAVVGKLVANGGVALSYTGRVGAAAIGVSMIPRAEITMIVMQKARSLGEWAAPRSAYPAMVLVSLVTAIAAPLVLRRLLKRLPR